MDLIVVELEEQFLNEPSTADAVVVSAQQRRYLRVETEILKRRRRLLLQTENNGCHEIYETISRQRKSNLYLMYNNNNNNNNNAILLLTPVSGCRPSLLEQAILTLK